MVPDRQLLFSRQRQQCWKQTCVSRLPPPRQLPSTARPPVQHPRDRFSSLPCSPRGPTCVRLCCSTAGMPYVPSDSELFLQGQQASSWLDAPQQNSLCCSSSAEWMSIPGMQHNYCWRAGMQAAVLPDAATNATADTAPSQTDTTTVAEAQKAGPKGSELTGSNLAR